MEEVLGEFHFPTATFLGGMGNSTFTGSLTRKSVGGQAFPSPFATGKPPTAVVV